jgi:hypothetical protein
MRSLIVGTRSVKVRRGPSTGTRFSSVTVTISTRGVSSRVIVAAEIEVELCVLIGELRNPDEGGPGVVDHYGSPDAEIVRFSELLGSGHCSQSRDMIFSFVLNGGRGPYPDYMTSPRDACQIPQRSDTTRLVEYVDPRSLVKVAGSRCLGSTSRPSS